MTVVMVTGEIRVLTPSDPLFTAMLGAGSALAVVVDVTLRVAPQSVVRGGEQRVMAFETRAQAVAYSHRALRLMKERILPDETVSLELVVAGTKVAENEPRASVASASRVNWSTTSARAASGRRAAGRA